MLISFDLLEVFWVKGIKAACYLINTYFSSSLNNKVPKQIWSGSMPNYFYLKTFWCATYACHSDSKLDPRSQKCIFLGYRGVKGYKLWLRDIKGYKVIISRSMIFNRDDFPCLSDKTREKIGDDDFIMTEINFNKENIVKRA